MTRTEQNLQLPFPENCHLLADRILANRFPFLTACKSVQLGTMKGPRLRKCRKFNSYLSCCRVSGENSIARLKYYRTVHKCYLETPFIFSKPHCEYIEYTNSDCEPLIYFHDHLVYRSF